MNKENNNKPNIINKIKEMRKDKKGKAILELSIYCVFFIVIIIFAKIGSLTHKNYTEEVSDFESSFINDITDNYEYDINIKYNENNYIYKGKVLGNNSSFIFVDDDIEKNYYIKDNKYYELDDNNDYVLTTEQEIYPYVDYKYLDIDKIKTFIDIATKENNVYKIKVADIILNSDSEEYVTITMNEENTTLEVDYTNLYKIYTPEIDKVVVTITYSNINNITSLEEENE